MKLINTKYHVLNTQDGNKTNWHTQTPNYKNIALYGLYIGLIGVFLFTALRGFV